MSWLFSQALVEEYSAANSLDGAPCALWSGTPTQQACSWLGKTTDACRLSRSGMMFKPLTGNHGEELLMSFLEAFPAPTFPVPEKERVSTEKPARCGGTWLESLAKYDQNSRSWRTAQCLLFEDLGESLETFPNWGIMRGGECWERTMLALPTAGRESGLWATPSARDWKDTPGMAFFSINADGTLRNREDQLARQVYASENATGGQLNPTWVEWLMGWPIGWTDLKPLETDKFQQWQHSHGEFLEVEND
jgi:hypothetical protein